MIEVFETFLSQMNNLNEWIELAAKIQQGPQTEKSSAELVDLLNKIDKVGEIMNKQLSQVLIREV